MRVIRSAKRRKTVQARFESDEIVVRIPASMSPREERDAVAKVVAKLQVTPRNDDALSARAHHLNRVHLEGRARLGSIRWVTNQNSRWGSCTAATGEIRISHRLQLVPDYVLDAVIVHELVHTFIPNHSAEFYEWADRVPNAERAKGYLEAYGRFSR